MVKKFSREIRDIDAAITAQENKAAALRLSLLPSSVGFGDKIKTTAGDSFGDRYARIAEELDKITQEVWRLRIARAEKIIEIADELDKLDDARQRLALAMYLLNGDSVKKIARRLDCSLSGAYKIINGQM